MAKNFLLVLCCLLSFVLWCHLLLPPKNLDGRSGEAELWCNQSVLKNRWRSCKIVTQLMLLGSLWVQQVVMELLNYVCELVWGGGGGALCGFVPTFNSKAVVQSMKANELSGAVLLWLILRKEHPDDSPIREPVGCVYSLWCSVASVTSAPRPNPFLMQDGTGVETN